MAKAKAKARGPRDIVDELQYLSDEDARALERTVLEETTGDHPLDPAEVVTDADS
jgi:hypothetical protein